MKKIFIVLLIIIFPIISWIFITPFILKLQVVSYYKSEFYLKLPLKDISVGPYMIEHEGLNANWSNSIYFEGEFDLKSDYFNDLYTHNINYSKKTVGQYILGTHLQYMKPYIVNELIYDKSKGNDFEKILEILEENKLEIC
ncbi:hypothetical protein HP397_01605, partial [Streptobacillus felis]|nr:hypothetical protein [Streptobacillus felis]